MTSARSLSSHRAVDFSLLLSRLEDQVIKGEGLERVRNMVKRTAVWKTLDPSMQARWALLAQMSGEIETALEVLAHINTVNPESVEPWTRRLELLSILDRREDLSRVFAISKQHLPPEIHAGLVERLKRPDQAKMDEGPSSIYGPFERLRSRQEEIGRFLTLFSGREDCFARQWADKPDGKQGYVPVRRPMEERDVEEHLRGRKTYGIYLLSSDSRVKLAVVDADVVKERRKSRMNAEDRRLLKREYHYLVKRLREEAESVGLDPLLEFSGGKGFHFWFFFDAPVSAAEARSTLRRLVRVVEGDVKCFAIEVFPKQDRLSGKGLGNLVKLPLGVHRLTGKRSYFPECVDRSVDAQLKHLMKVSPVKAEKVSSAAVRREQELKVAKPRFHQWERKYPELSTLERCCPPLGRILSACRGNQTVTMREEKVIFQTIGLLPRAKTLIHHLFSTCEEYNPHLIDYRLSRVRGKPLGCRRVHSLLQFTGDMCPFTGNPEYPHPLLHVESWKDGEGPRAEKVENLSSALESLRTAISQVEIFLK